MFNGWLDGLLAGLQTINNILTAGIAITAFSLFLYALSFNLQVPSRNFILNNEFMKVFGVQSNLKTEKPRCHSPPLDDFGLLSL